MRVTPPSIFGAKCKWKPCKRDKSTSRDFIAHGRPLRGQKRLAPLTKRSTCSKSRVLYLAFDRITCRECHSLWHGDKPFTSSPHNYHFYHCESSIKPPKGLLVCEQALHLGEIEKSTRTSGTWGESRHDGRERRACNNLPLNKFSFLPWKPQDSTKCENCHHKSANYLSSLLLNQDVFAVLPTSQHAITPNEPFCFEGWNTSSVPMTDLRSKFDFKILMNNHTDGNYLLQKEKVIFLFCRFSFSEWVQWSPT